MKKGKRNLIVIVALSAALAFGTPVMAAGSLPFKDVSPRHYEAISELYQSNVIKGISETEFGVENPLKRGDAAVILAGVLGLNTTNAPDAGFKDINKRVGGSVNALVQAGIMNGFSKTTFSPDSLLTRGQMAKILVNAYHLQDYAKETPFNDLSKTFKKEIEALYGAGITTGLTADQYGTEKNIKRGDFAILLNKTMDFSEQEGSQVKSISQINPIAVTVGATIDELALPSEIEVVYKNDSKKKLKVDWDTSKLNLNQAGEYIINGAIEGIEEQASVTVKVHSVGIEGISDIHVAQGTKNEDLELPQQVKVTYHDETIENKAVTWDLSGLLLNQPGEYVINGKIDGVSDNASVKVIVESVTVEPLQEINVMEGSLMEGVELPQQVKVTHQDGTVENKEVNWDVSPLNLNQHGEYVLNGTISNTTLKATIKVVVIKEYPEQVTLGNSQAVLKEGRTHQLTATFSPGAVAKKNITWTSSNNAVATVNENGLVTAVAEGEAVITVTTENGKTASTTITVSNKPNLQTNVYASVSINDLAKSVSISFTNLDSQKVTVEKIEVYEKNRLFSTYNKSELEVNGISTEIDPMTQFGMSIQSKLGIWKDNSYVKFYIKSNENNKVYEYIDYL